MRVLLVDDDGGLVQALTRHGSRVPDLDLVATTSALEGREMARDGMFDAVVVEEWMSGCRGTEILADIVARMDVAKVLITGRNEMSVADRATELDVDRILYKIFDPQRLWASTFAAAARRHELAGLARVRAAIQSMTAGGRLESVVPASIPAQKLDLLTDAEHRVLELVCRGFRAKEIASRRGVAESTVRAQLHAIYTTIGVRGWDEIQRLCRASGGSPSDTLVQTRVSTTYPSIFHRADR